MEPQIRTLIIRRIRALQLWARNCCCSVAQSCPTLCDPMDARQASLSFTISWSLFKLMSIESLMPSNHLILRRPLILLPSVSSSIRVFPVKIPVFKYKKYQYLNTDFYFGLIRSPGYILYCFMLNEILLNIIFTNSVLR